MPGVIVSVPADGPAGSARMEKDSCSTTAAGETCGAWATSSGTRQSIASDSVVGTAASETVAMPACPLTWVRPVTMPTRPTPRKGKFEPPASARGASWVTSTRSPCVASIRFARVVAQSTVSAPEVLPAVMAVDPEKSGSTKAPELNAATATYCPLFHGSRPLRFSVKGVGADGRAAFERPNAACDRSTVADGVST